MNCTPVLLSLEEFSKKGIQVEQSWIPLKGEQKKLSPQSHPNNKLFFKDPKEHCHVNQSSLQTPVFSLDGILAGSWS
jgi:hypothetical protein